MLGLLCYLHRPQSYARLRPQAMHPVSTSGPPLEHATLIFMLRYELHDEFVPGRALGARSPRLFLREAAGSPLQTNASKHLQGGFGRGFPYVLAMRMQDGADESPLWMKGNYARRPSSPL